ncbi:7tm odorant receptor domain-containing protein [Phthorimaea operculella]|nr:7tm odorant receptor domain-containing protein [Phthorimaea operculella]
MSTKSPHFDISTPRRRAILDFWLTNNERYFKLLLLLGTCTLAVWYVYPLVDDKDYNLVFAIRLPYDYTKPSRYPVTYAVVLIAFHYAAYFVMVNDVIMLSHLMHLICQFMVLGDCFERIVDDCARDFLDLDRSALHHNKAFVLKYNNRLGDLVEQHKFILRNTLELRRILSVPMLYQMAASSMLICFAGYQVTAAAKSADITKFLISLLYLGYNMFELFIFCRWCDEIKHQSEKIRGAVYFSGWERVCLIPGVRARLMIVIARASRPMVLTAGGVYDLSLNSYGTIVKTSYSALSVLLRTQRD